MALVEGSSLMARPRWLPTSSADSRKRSLQHVAVQMPSSGAPACCAAGRNGVNADKRLRILFNWNVQA